MLIGGVSVQSGRSPDITARCCEGVIGWKISGIARRVLSGALPAEPLS